MLIHIASSRLLRKVALNTNAAVKKFVDDFINNPNNVERIKSYIEKNCRPKWHIDKKDKIYNDNFIGTVEAIYGTVGGEIYIELFRKDEFDKFIKNGIKENLSIKDKFKSFFSNSAKEKIKNEVYKALIEYIKTHINELIKPYLYDVFIKGYIKGLYSEVPSEERLINDDKLQKNIQFKAGWTDDKVYILATVPVFKIDFNARNYRQKTVELAQEQINQIYSGELQKVLKRWQVNDPPYFNQIKNYLVTNLQNIARREQYKKMNGNK